MIRQAIKECSKRSLFVSTKWLSELLLYSEYEFSDETENETIDKFELWTKSLFEMREYSRYKKIIVSFNHNLE